jgi:hypothetical protein
VNQGYRRPVDANELLRAVERAEEAEEAARAAAIERAIPWVKLLAAVREGAAGDWRHDAACKGQLEAMFPERGRSADLGLELCHACPVQDQCGQWSTSLGDELHGTAAGMTRDDRAQVRRMIRAAAA